MALVQIRHGLHKPSVCKGLNVRLCGIGIPQRRASVCGGREGSAVIDPIFGGRVCDPGMLIAAVIHDHVHDHLHVPIAGCIRQLPVVCIRSKTRVYAVVIGRGIAVVGPLGLVILQNGIQPNGRKPHAIKVVEVRFNSGNVPPMAAVIIFATHAFTEPLDLIVIWIAIGKTVGCNEANGV